MQATLPQEQLARSVCDFLSEMLRTKQVSLERGAEIASAVTHRLQTIRSESDFLDAVRELEFDFQELHALHSELQMHSRLSDRQSMEHLVRLYAADILVRDPKGAVTIMEEALRPDVTLDWLLRKYPAFNQFYEQQRRR